MDLPGYGFAKRSYEDRDRWNAFTKEYFTQRGSLVNVSLLVDASVPPQVRHARQGCAMLALRQWQVACRFYTSYLSICGMPACIV